MVQKGTNKYIKKVNTIYGTFKDYYKLLEGSKKPKGQKVLWLMNEMLIGKNYANEVVPDDKSPSIFLNQSDDHKDVKHLRKLIESEFQEKVLKEIPIFVWMAAILTPPLKEEAKKYLKSYNDGEYYKYDEAIKEIENKLSYLADIEFDQQQSNQVNPNPNHNNNQSRVIQQQQVPVEAAPQQPQRKKARFSFTPTRAQQPTHKRQAQRKAKGEIRRYLEADYDPDFSELHFDNPLEYWCDPTIKSAYPKLAKVALWVLVIAITSCSVERLFSLCGNILTNKRLRLTTENVSILVKLKTRSRSRD